MASQGGHLWQELNVNDTLLQQTSTISGVRRPNSAGKSWSGSSTLMPSESCGLVDRLGSVVDNTDNFLLISVVFSIL